MADISQARWYVIHTYSGYENKVKVNLEKAVENNGLQDMILDVQIPIEEAIEIKNNRRKTVQHKLLPGYVLVKMIMTNESWYIVRNTRGVTGFVGSGNKPTPLSDADYAAVFEKKTGTIIDIGEGDEVRILTGLFENFNGRVISIDRAKEKIVVSVPMLKRETTVELDYDQVVRED